ncbi:MAG: Lrp/AsnC family transcriptional regulator [Polyangiales bacterium]
MDLLDREIIIELQADAKSSLKEIGERIGLSAPSVMERVRKLEQSGVITGYHASVDAKKAGLDICAFIGVLVGDSQRITDFEVWLDGVPQVLECHHVTGGHTLLLKVKTQNTAALEALIRRIRASAGVTSTETMLVLSTQTERVQLALPFSDEEADGGRRKRSRQKAS